MPERVRLSVWVKSCLGVFALAMGGSALSSCTKVTSFTGESTWVFDFELEKFEKDERAKRDYLARVFEKQRRVLEEERRMREARQLQRGPDRREPGLDPGGDRGRD